jgi:hypothetical protein
MYCMRPTWRVLAGLQYPTIGTEEGLPARLERDMLSTMKFLVNKRSFSNPETAKPPTS